MKNEHIEYLRDFILGSDTEEPCVTYIPKMMEVDGHIRALWNDLEKLKKQNEIYREALEFYSDIQNWFQIEDREFSDAVMDKGYFSRVALKQVEELNHRE